VRRQAEARQRGEWPGPSDDLGTTRFAAMIPWWRPAAVRKLRASGRPLDILIAVAAHFRYLRRRAVNSRPLQLSAFCRRMQLCARFAGLPLGMAGLVVLGARGGLGGSGRLGPGPTPGGWEAAAAAILMISPASCRGRHHLRASALARAMLGTYSLDYAQQDWLGAAGPRFSPGGDSCRPATFWCGCASECWRSRYPTLLAPRVWVPTVIRL
jgi:hypothetical protein